MNMKKILPVLMLVIMAVIALGIKNCRNSGTATSKPERETRPFQSNKKSRATTNNYNAPTANQGTGGLDRNPANLFYTKHAKCRMKCRHITQREVADILVKGTINYNKSDLQDARGPKYAVEGKTDDGQKVRIIFAPNSKHISVVTVIDLVEDFACSCD